MNHIIPHHDAKIRPPFYNEGNGGQLHRYLAPDFVPQYLKQLSANSLDSQENTQWQQDDCFSRHGKETVLRRAIHKTFYVFSCEVVCNRIGLPAVNEQKITSAGFVIRRYSQGKEYSWMIVDDEPVGWQETYTGLRDPDEHRHICRFGVLHPRENVPTYSGEHTHPMHPQPGFDTNGKRHTLLYGYVPVGGQYIPRRKKDATVFSPESLAEFNDATKKHLAWPFGERPPYKDEWRADYTRPVFKGRASLPFFELIRLLVNRYHLGEDHIVENQTLEDFAKSIYFYHVDDRTSNEMRTHFNDRTKDNYRQFRKYSLWYWLNTNFKQDQNALIAWITQQEQAIESALDSRKTADQANFTYMPQHDGTGTIRYSLFLSASDARMFRTYLNQRVIDNATQLANEMPVEKFQQEKDDIYRLVPFVRIKDEHGKERIFWGDNDSCSRKFRVASAFDPLASRPSMIQMPSLQDLRSGLAKGVGMITPPDTFSLLNALHLKKGANEDVVPSGEPSQLGIQWICSFSLPVITLVAMILLMIMISLLNILFFWLPWIKICLPFPKIK